ncbi:MAG TPA: TlpA disulfide reductase family protein [Mizugakiibacter sp.]
MRDRASLWIVAVALAAGLAGMLAGRWWQTRQPPAPPGVTVLAPGDHRADLALPGVDGTIHRLSSWDGKLVLLNFWATWCGPCREEMPTLEQAQQRYGSRGLQVVGIALDEPAAVQTYLGEVPVRYPILIGLGHTPDPSILFGDTRGALPYSVLIGRDGRILKTKLGDFTPAELAGWIEASL